ncbi:TetR/AcrR family transcriptional regulator [Mycolicibacterium sphagni]|jgi:AcrR family transcriptional regulator|uniref:TetR family transcriptional regulator n=1 Tax=Mycolicibacterium sphagni TaxID=1786 RepID=A0A255DC83_9MYCO|nr:TetR family transcriptional regulator [Mycolicibacterium sphagni]OYN77047.1 TetR family transcriptional regulator [Mycolicibacterium sphagni]
MTTAIHVPPTWPASTRRRVLDAAIALFGQYSFAGTSLQMIADDLALTKAAIYYHFRTRDDLLLALMAPIFTEIADVVDAAEKKKRVQVRTETMLIGYAGIVVRHRALAAITTFDPSVRAVLREQPDWSVLIDRQLALLAGADRGEHGRLDATIVLTGLAAAASAAPQDLDGERLRLHLIDAGRRILGLPAITR